jgi:hypothetical protein
MVDAGVGGVSGRSVLAVNSRIQQHARLDLSIAYLVRRDGGTQR